MATETLKTRTEKVYDCEHAGTSGECGHSRHILYQDMIEALRDVYTLLPPERVNLIRPMTQAIIRRTLK